jgi:hypothetical protein
MAAVCAKPRVPAITCCVIERALGAAHSAPAPLAPKEISMARTLLILLFAAFGAWSTYVLFDVGYVGILRSHLVNSGSIQVACDLVIALGLVCAWMVQDARSRGRNAWPFVIATVFLGSFGPLLYLLLRGEARDGRIARRVAAEMIR